MWKKKKKNGWKLHYQVLLIAYLKLTKKNTKHAWKKKIKSECEFIGLKIIN